MKLGYELTIEQTQKLVMTPELIQAIQILQFNTQELDSFVQEQLLTNPILEKEEKIDTDDREEDILKESSAKIEELERDWAEYFKDTDLDDISYKQHYQSSFDPDKEEFTYEQFVSSEITLTDHLFNQLQYVELKPACKEVVKYLIEALDENGYLTSSVEEVAEVFGIGTDKVLEALEILQGFEPVGVGDRNLKECLLIQMVNNGDDSR